MSPHLLLRHEFSLGSFFNSIQIGILFIDKEYQIESPNKACTVIFQRSGEELSSTPFDSLIQDEYKDQFTQTFEKLIAEKGNTDSEIMELMVLNKKGESIPVELNINSTLTLSDNLYILVINDISKRIELERKVKRQNENMEEIEDELQKEQELGELKSRFVTMASHEFRTPLAGVLSSVNLVQRYLDAEEESGTTFLHKKKIESHFIKIKESVGSLTQILNEFLSLGKLEEGKIQCHWEAVDITNLLNSTTSELQKLCKPNQLIVTTNITSRSIYNLDANMIRNIINNLITNAIKYSDAGSEINLLVQEHQNQLMIHVKDEGYGIPEEDQKKLFGRFFRAKNVTNIQGTGLGLNIVKKYIEMMGGSISFKSALNQGSTFTVLIPIKDEL